MPVFTTAIRCFVEVAKRGSIRGSAEHLFLTPSAVNRQIIGLEQEMSAVLFERLPRGMRLTAAGELLLASIRRQERELAVTVSQMEMLKGLKRGHIVLACLSYLGPLHLTQFIAQFRLEHPGITFTLLAGTNAEVYDWVTSGTADIGVCYQPPRGLPLQVQKSIPVRFGAVVHASHALAGRTGVGVRELLTHPLVLPAEGMETRHFADQLGLLRWPDHVIAVETNSFSMVIELVKAGVGISFLADVDAAAEVAKGSIAFVPIKDTHVPKAQVCLTIRIDRTLPFATSTALEALGAHLDRMGEAGAAI